MEVYLLLQLVSLRSGSLDTNTVLARVCDSQLIFTFISYGLFKLVLLTAENYWGEVMYLQSMGSPKKRRRRTRPPLPQLWRGKTRRRHMAVTAEVKEEALEVRGWADLQPRIESIGQPYCIGEIIRQCCLLELPGHHVHAWGLA